MYWGETRESGPGQSGWPSERKGGEGIKGGKRGNDKKRSIGRREWSKGRVRRMDWEEKRAEGWVGCEGAGKCGPFQYPCLANIICIEPMRMEFCVTLICIHLHKINPLPNCRSDCF